MNRISKTFFRSYLRWNRQAIVHSVPFTIQPSFLGIENLLPKNVTIVGPEGVQAAIYHCFRTQSYSSKNTDLALNVLRKLNEMSSSMKSRLEQQKEHILDTPILDLDKLFKLGQIVQLKKNKIRAVVVGWKYDAKEGKQMVSLVYDDHDFGEFVSPNEQMMVSVPADDLQLVTDNHLKRVHNSAIKTYFSHFDTLTGRYVPLEDVAFLYPLDLQGVDYNPHVLSEQGASSAKRIYTDLMGLQGEIQKMLEKSFPGILDSTFGPSTPTPFIEPLDDDTLNAHFIVRHVLGELMAQVKDLVPRPEDFFPPTPTSTFGRKLLRGASRHSATRSTTHPTPNLTSVLKIRSLQENIPHTHAAVFSALSRFSDVIFNIDQLLALRYQTKGIGYADALHVQDGTIKVYDIHPKLHRYLVRSTIPSPAFSVGQVVEHKQFGYRGVVVGYDMRPLQDVSQWEGVINLPLGQEQVFYKIVPDDRDVSNRRTYYYVAQENLQLVEEPSRKLVQHKELKKYFVGYDVSQGVFTAPHKLKYCFPGAGQEWGEKYPELTELQRYREKHNLTEEPKAAQEDERAHKDVDSETELEKLKVKVIEQQIAVYENIDKCLLTIRDHIRGYLFNFIQTMPNPVLKVEDNEDEGSDGSSRILHPVPLSFYASRHTQDLLQLLNESLSREAALGIENVMWSAHVLSRDHNAMIAMRLGISELKRRNVSQAVRHFKRCVELDHEYTEAYNKLAVSYQSVGEFQRCKEEGQKAAQLMPHHYGACAGMALAYEKKGETSKALHYLRRVLDVHPWAANIPTVLLAVQGKKGKGDDDAASAV